MTVDHLPKLLTPHAQAADPTSLSRHFGGGDGPLPVWITGPYLELASVATAAIDVAIDRLRRAIEGIGS